MNKFFKLSVIALALLSGSVYAENKDVFNPKPDAEDVILSTPCDGRLVFRKVYTSKDKSKIKDKDFHAGTVNSSSPIAQNPNTRYVQGSFHDDGGYFFLIGKYELMEAQYNYIMDPSKCKAPSKKDSLPKVKLSYFDALSAARAYSLYLNTAEDKILNSLNTKEAKVFARLPSDDEWEFAERGGIAVTVSQFEGNIPPVKDDDIANYAWFEGAKSANGRLQLSGLKEPNPLGIYDMLGNAQEMVLEPFKAVRTGRLLGLSGALCVRGGGFRTPVSLLSSATRSEKMLYVKGRDLVADDVGVRFVLGLPVTTSVAEVKQLNDEVQKIADGDGTDNNSLKGASSEIKKLEDAQKKEKEAFDRQKGELLTKNDALLQENSSLEEKNVKLSSINKDLIALNDSLSKSNEELNKKMSSLKNQIEAANTERVAMRDAAVIANLRLGSFLCKEISDSVADVARYDRLVKVTQSQCERSKDRCSNVEKVQISYENSVNTLKNMLTYYGDIMTTATAEYSFDEFVSHFAQAQSAFGSDKGYEAFLNTYLKHLSEFKKMSKNTKENAQYWSDSCHVK